MRLNRKKTGFLILSFCFLLLPALNAAKKKMRRALPPAPPPSNRVSIVTSDDASFRGLLLDEEAGLLTLRTEEGEELNFPVAEVLSINGAPPAAYLKRFVPLIPDDWLKDYSLAAGAKMRCVFSFLKDWEKSEAGGLLQFQPAPENTKWLGVTARVSCETPPGVPDYAALLKRLKEGGSVSKESYEVVAGTPALFTAETEKSGLQRKCFRQFRSLNGESVFLQISLAAAEPQKLAPPRVEALLKKAARSLRLEAAEPPKKP